MIGFFAEPDVLPVSPHGRRGYGPELAEKVVVVDILPVTLTYVSATPAVGFCGHDGGIVTCELGDLAAGKSVLITIVVETEPVGEGI